MCVCKSGVRNVNVKVVCIMSVDVKVGVHNECVYVKVVCEM